MHVPRIAAVATYTSIVNYTSLPEGYYTPGLVKNKIQEQCRSTICIRTALLYNCITLCRNQYELRNIETLTGVSARHVLESPSFATAPTRARRHSSLLPWWLGTIRIVDTSYYWWHNVQKSLNTVSSLFAVKLSYENVSNAHSVYTIQNLSNSSIPMRCLLCDKHRPQGKQKKEKLARRQSPILDAGIVLLQLYPLYGLMRPHASKYRHMVSTTCVGALYQPGLVCRWRKVTVMSHFHLLTFLLLHKPKEIYSCCYPHRLLIPEFIWPKTMWLKMYYVTNLVAKFFNGASHSKIQDLSLISICTGKYIPHADHKTKLQIFFC